MLVYFAPFLFQCYCTYFKSDLCSSIVLSNFSGFFNSFITLRSLINMQHNLIIFDKFFPPTHEKKVPPISFFTYTNEKNVPTGVGQVVKKIKKWSRQFLNLFTDHGLFCLPIIIINPHVVGCFLCKNPICGRLESRRRSCMHLHFLSATRCNFPEFANCKTFRATRLSGVL